MKLKNKKRCLRKDVDAMTSSADEYAVHLNFLFKHSMKE